jgi:NADH-quinone oxidoreductase subunit G
MKRASEFESLITVNANLFGEDPAAAKVLEKINTRVAISPFDDETVKEATIAIGVRHWSEVQGTMVNSLNILQKLNACPVCPDENLWAPYAVLSYMAGTKFECACEAFKKVGEYVPALAGLTYDAIKSTGKLLEGGEA